MSDDKIPLCAILKPAPWQNKGLAEDTEPWGHTGSGLFQEPDPTVELLEEEMEELFRDRENTPLTERSEELAEELRREDSVTEEVVEVPKQKDTRLPSPGGETDIWNLDLWNRDEKD